MTNETAIEILKNTKFTGTMIELGMVKSAIKVLEDSNTNLIEEAKKSLGWYNNLLDYCVNQMNERGIKAELKRYPDRLPELIIPEKEVSEND